MQFGLYKFIIKCCLKSSLLPEGHNMQLLFLEVVNCSLNFKGKILFANYSPCFKIMVVFILKMCMYNFIDLVCNTNCQSKFSARVFCLPMIRAFLFIIFCAGVPIQKTCFAFLPFRFWYLVLHAD